VLGREEALQHALARQCTQIRLEGHGTLMQYQFDDVTLLQVAGVLDKVFARQQVNPAFVSGQQIRSIKGKCNRPTQVSEGPVRRAQGGSGSTSKVSNSEAHFDVELPRGSNNLLVHCRGRLPWQRKQTGRATGTEVYIDQPARA
jgi:hypothetical protein